MGNKYFRHPTLSTIEGMRKGLLWLTPLELQELRKLGFAVATLGKEGERTWRVMDIAPAEHLQEVGICFHAKRRCLSAHDSLQITPLLRYMEYFYCKQPQFWAVLRNLNSPKPSALKQAVVA